MTAASDPNAFVAATVAKVKQGIITPNDLSELREAVKKNREAIPYLNRSFVNGACTSPSPLGTSLVRYVGMVQDMLETEYFVSEIHGVKTHYRDVRHMDENLQDIMDIAPKLDERQPLVVVPIPFASEWVRSKEQLNMVAPSKLHPPQQLNPSSSKRQLSSDVTDPPTKRTAMSTPDTSIDDDSMQTEKEAERRAHAHNITGPPGVDWWPPGCMSSDPTCCPVLAKMYYDDNQESRLKLNEVVELIGVLSMDPMDVEEPQDELDEFSFVKIPPPSLLPRLHVLCYNRLNLESDHGNGNGAIGMEMDSSLEGDERSFAIESLAKHVFNGDKVAAKALLLALLSMAEREHISQGTWTPVKTPSETTLGCASLNFVLSSERSCSKLQSRLSLVLSKILPVVGSLHLSRESLGRTVHSPAKNDAGRLEPSPLQLPRGAFLIVDQSSLTEGRIDDRAEEILRALNSMTRSHTVPYHFEGQMLYNFEADYRLIVLSTSSQGRKLLPCLMRMKLSDDVCNFEVLPDIIESDCTRIRSYLSKCRCKTKVSLSNKLFELAQHEFIERRADYRRKAEERKRIQTFGVGAAAYYTPPSVPPEVGEEDFHRWLTLARLQARSRLPLGPKSGSSEDDSDDLTWNDVLRLDDEMQATTGVESNGRNS